VAPPGDAAAEAGQDGVEWVRNGTAMPTSRITSRGRTTLPRAVRERLRLRPGDRVAYVAKRRA